MATDIMLFAKPCPLARRHYYSYSASLNGVEIISGSHDPEPDIARRLLQDGRKGIVRVIDGRTGKVRSFVNVEQAARIRHTDGDRGLKTEKWKSFKFSNATKEVPEAA